MPLLPPSHVRIWGHDDLQREESRQPDALRLDWDDVPNATGYNIEVNGQVTLQGIARDVLVENLSPNTRHTIRVSAIDSNDNSPWSTHKVFATRPPTPLVAPTLSARDTARGDSYLILKWIDQGYAYDLKINEHIVVAKPEDMIDGLEPNSAVRVQLRARDDAVGGSSFWSPSVIFATRPPLPPMPTILPYQVGESGFVIHWSVPHFRGWEYASVTLIRTQSDGTPTRLAIAQNLSDSLVDDDYNRQGDKHYALVVVVGAAGVPLGTGLSENTSLYGPFAVTDVPRYSVRVTPAPSMAMERLGNILQLNIVGNRRLK